MKVCGVAVLLTCAWVLWQTSFPEGNRPEHTVMGAAETAKGCYEMAPGTARAVAKAIGGKLDAENVVVTRGDLTFVFRCLPDTVKP
jgi:hypothetical protein